MKRRPFRVINSGMYSTWGNALRHRFKLLKNIRIQVTSDMDQVLCLRPKITLICFSCSRFSLPPPKDKILVTPLFKIQFVSKEMSIVEFMLSELSFIFIYILLLGLSQYVLISCKTEKFRVLLSTFL